MESSERIRLLEGNLDRQLTWIRAADSKSGLAFALNTGMLGVLAAVAPTQASGWGVASAVFAALALLLGLIGLVFLSFASFPRVEGPRGSVVFFGGISQRSAVQFKEAITTLSDEDYVEDLASQCHRNAEIASRKFSWVRASFVCLYLAVIPWGLAILLLHNSWG